MVIFLLQIAIMMTSVVFTVGALLMALANGPELILVGRITVGAAIGRSIVVEFKVIRKNTGMGLPLVGQSLWRSKSLGRITVGASIGRSTVVEVDVSERI